MFKKLILIFLLSFISVLFLDNFLYAEKIAIVYTGDSHASLYPCRCPKNPDGGIARRLTKIKELRKEYPNLLLLDSGNYFASGVEDPDSHGPELDKKRTEVYLNAMSMMDYDAAGIGKDEFNFGQEFLEKVIKETKFNFLSCNLALPQVSPFIIKEFGSTKIGILAVSPTETVLGNKQDMAQVVNTVKDNIKKLKGQKVNLVILLSQLAPGLDEQLLQQVEGVDIIIASNISSKYKTGDKIAQTLYLKPYVWTRILGVLELDMEDGKIAGVAPKIFPMATSIADDVEIKNILPSCFQDKECYKDNQKGLCKSPGTKDATCVYSQGLKVPLIVIFPKDCRTCNIQAAVDQLKSKIAGISEARLASDDKKAKDLIKKFKITMLPVFFLGKEIEKYDDYKNLLSNKIIEKKDDNYYMVNPFVIGVSYFLERKIQENRLDLFISLGDKASKNVLEITKNLLDKSNAKFDFHLHFLAVQDEASGEFRAPQGISEIEEDKRALCVIKNYPDKWWDYLFCRMKNIQSSWWDDCALELGIDAAGLKECAKSGETNNLLKENIKPVQELQIYYGPLFLLSNKEIFGATEKTTLEE
ncbi:MAG: hypothetical protein FJZ11_02230, partial [Candidatus Omnitrophica bacterium]|nr:hypothetical protein [Candidatus Omnitrophota bacterium]